MDSLSTGIDGFAIALTDIIGDTMEDVTQASNKAVSRSTRKGVKTVRSYAKKGGLHKWSDEYVGGFQSHLSKNGPVTVGEIGNRKKPGLVHLLEKGHLTLTGRRTRAYPHLAPAYGEIEKDYIDQMEKLVGRALGG
jgi:hypothetical protein